MEYRCLAPFDLVFDRFHQALTGGGAIAGVDIDMPTPEASGTVVCVAIAIHRFAAVKAAKRFDAALKTARVGHSQRGIACERCPRQSEPPKGLASIWNL